MTSNSLKKIRSKKNMHKNPIGLRDEQIQDELLNADLKALGFDDDLSGMEIQEKINLITALKQSTNTQQEETSPSNKLIPRSSSVPQMKNNIVPIPKESNLINVTKSSINKLDDYSRIPSTSNNRNNSPKPTYAAKLLNITPSKMGPIHEDIINLDSNSNNEEYFNKIKNIPEEEATINKDNEDEEKAVDNEECEDGNGSNDDSNSSRDDDGDDEEFEDDHFFSIPNFEDNRAPCLKHTARKQPAIRKHRYYKYPNQSDRECFETLLYHYNMWRKKWRSLVNKTGSDVDVSNLGKPNLIKQDLPSPSTSKFVKIPSSLEIININRNSPSPIRACDVIPSPRREEIVVTDVKSPQRESELRITELTNVEEKVPCPICLIEFFKSKIESHAAVCDSFPTETRHQTRNKYGTEERGGFSNASNAELTIPEKQIPSKRRGENGDNQINKRLRLNDTL